ncbi:hypothetical protein ACWGCW_31565 [Streptomyces sp. NPDC054933]
MPYTRHRNAPSGWYARYADDPLRAVEGFTEDDLRSALVVDPKAARLVRATDLPGFQKLIDSTEVYDEVVAAVPGDGWRVLCKDKDDPEGTWTAPVTAFLVLDGGQVVPAWADSGDCYAEDRGPVELLAPPGREPARTPLMSVASSVVEPAAV